ncbi:MULTISPECIES: hypothetical protein [Haloferax]|uniref:hypothetical protein n=1 Tax=Haloferax TaxID=2251 RepID=UPI002B40C38B|nr:hypothetical protein [Haloferax marinisediminis]
MSIETSAVTKAYPSVARYHPRPPKYATKATSETPQPYHSGCGPLSSWVVVSDCRCSRWNRLVVPDPPVRDGPVDVRFRDVRDDERDDPLVVVFDRLELPDDRDRVELLVRLDVRVEEPEDERFEDVDRDDVVRREDEPPDDRVDDDVDPVDDVREDDVREDDVRVERDDEAVEERDDEDDDVDSVDVPPLPACPGNLNLFRPSRRFST